jgi:hypothetical protein
VLPDAQRTDIDLTALAIVLTLVYAVGLLFRPRRRIARMGVDSVAVLILYLLGDEVANLGLVESAANRAHKVVHGVLRNLRKPRQQPADDLPDQSVLFTADMHLNILGHGRGISQPERDELPPHRIRRMNGQR